MFSSIMCMGTWPGPSFMTWTPLAQARSVSSPCTFEFAELGFVVGVGDRAGTEAVADGEADVVGGHDVADVVPVGVEEVLLVMGEAPLGHDAAAAADDAGHARGRDGDEAEEDAGVDGEVIDALLGLLDEGVAEDLPGEVLGLAVHFFERLVDGHGADRARGCCEGSIRGWRGCSCRWRGP